MPEAVYALDTLNQFIGQELGVSSWFEVDQARIQAFADCTGDDQWIHIDVERAGRESPFGAPIAHGYLTLSLLPTLRKEIGVVPEGVWQAVNYGLDRVRFLTPVKAGVCIRARVVLLAAEAKGPDRWLVTTRNTVEIEGEERPAMIAEVLTLFVRA